MGAGEIYSVFVDRPAVRDFTEYLTTGESVRHFLTLEQGGVSPHKDAQLVWYTDFEQGYAQILMNADTFRFDGSDMMPWEVGAGTFWEGIVDYVNRVDLDTILATIDASWP